VYAVCTLTRGETTGVAAAFSAAHPELHPEPVGTPVVAGSAPTAAANSGLTLWPHELEANGMFIAAWKRVP
jgi:16S rRNA (cytosine967-C5)-methyltransferase